SALDGEVAVRERAALDLDPLGRDALAEGRVRLRDRRHVAEDFRRDEVGVVSLDRPVKPGQRRVLALVPSLADAGENDAMLMDFLVDGRARVPNLRIPDLRGTGEGEEH